MPFIFDFTKLQNIKTIEVNPEGWISPLYVEYGMSASPIDAKGILTYFWRVKGTRHTFQIPVVRMDFLSSGDYKLHFNEVLEVFRKDYIEWREDGWTTEWSRQYRDEYSRFIIVN